MYQGNVVHFKKRPGVMYVVKEAKYIDRKLESIILIPFDHSNSSTHISRKHPLTTEEYINPDCVHEDCDCYGPCETRKIPDLVYNIDEIQFVDDCVTDFIKNRLMNIFKG